MPTTLASPLEQIVLLLGASVLLVLLLHRLRAPSLLAFLIAGLASGPTGLGLIDDTHAIHEIAEYGVVFLLFMLGLEFSLPRLVLLRNTVFGIGSAQVLLCGGVFFLALWATGLDAAASFVIAGGLALSSTAIVSRELVATAQLHLRHGQIAIGILLFQDIAAVFLLILLPVLAGGASDGLLLRFADPLLRGTLLFLAMLAAGRWLLPRLLEETARTRSGELFLMTALLMALVAAWVTHLAGLSMALGAFLAGMVLGESRFRHQIESDIRPFRDLLLGLFFISIGMLMDLQMLQAYWPRIVVFGLLLVLFKFVLIAAMTWRMRETPETALRTGLALAQGGEFFFALLALAAREKLVPADVTSFMISVTVVSMVATPPLVRHGERISAFLLRRLPSLAPRTAQAQGNDLERLHSHAAELEGHVVILGYGRVGQVIARFLRRTQVPFVALDTDVVRVREAATAGDNVFFGDPVRPDILLASGIARARLLVISFDSREDALRILHGARELRPDLPILVRTRDDRALEELQQAGATEVVPETLEASLMLVSHVLMLLKVSPRQIMRQLQDVRAQRYQVLHGYFAGESGMRSDGETLHAVVLDGTCRCLGRRLAEFDLAAHEVRVQAIRRGEETLESPGPEVLFEPGDVVMLLGPADAIGDAEDLLRTGR